MYTNLRNLDEEDYDFPDLPTEDPSPDTDTFIIDIKQK